MQTISLTKLISLQLILARSGEYQLEGNKFSPDKTISDPVLASQQVLVVSLFPCHIYIFERSQNKKIKIVISTRTLYYIVSFCQVKERCRKGIPPSVRSRAWQYLCGSKFLMDHNQGKYEVSTDPYAPDKKG